MGVERVSNMVIFFPKSVREKLGDEAAEDLVKVFNDTYATAKNDFDLTLKNSIEGVLANFKSEIIQYIGEKESRLTWKMLTFMAAQTALFIAIVKLIR